MKKDDILYNNFINIIKERIPEKGKLANELTDFLGIEKEAIYRRLRGDVPFSFSEIAKISRKYGISLDTIAEGANLNSRPFNLQLSEFMDPNDIHLNSVENFASNIKSLRTDSDSEFGSVATMIPAALCMSYMSLFKFYVYKWYMQFKNQGYRISFTDLKIDERLLAINDDFVRAVRTSPSCVYIFDELFMYYFTKDIKYFEDIKLLTRYEIDLIKEALLLYLYDLERYAINGSFDEGGKVQIYISNIHFEGNFNFIDSKQYKLTMFRLFTLNEVYSTDEKVCEEMKKWCIFLKRASTLISQSSELKRIEFFERQREMVGML